LENTFALNCTLPCHSVDQLNTTNCTELCLFTALGARGFSPGCLFCVSQHFS